MEKNDHSFNSHNLSHGRVRYKRKIFQTDGSFKRRELTEGLRFQDAVLQENPFKDVTGPAETLHRPLRLMRRGVWLELLVSPSWTSLPRLSRPLRPGSVIRVSSIISFEETGTFSFTSSNFPLQRSSTKCRGLDIRYLYVSEQPRYAHRLSTVGVCRGSPTGSAQVVSMDTQNLQRLWSGREYLQVSALSYLRI